MKGAAIFFGVTIMASAVLAAPAANADSLKPVIKAERVEFKKSEGKVIFTGNVVITRGGDVMYADNAVKDEKKNVIETWGNVRGSLVSGSSETARLKTGRARWELDEDRIKLNENPEIIYTSTSTGEITVISDSMTIENALKEAVFDGGVKMNYRGNVAESDLAKYIHREGKILLLEHNGKMPQVSYSNEHRADFRAEEITIFMGDRTMYLKRDVECLVYR
jgi:lipopolysaccharide export system protein LptA